MSYFKTDAQNETYFDELALPHFEYEKQGKRLQMSYRRAPESALDEPTNWLIGRSEAIRRHSERDVNCGVRLADCSIRMFLDKVRHQLTHSGR